MKHPRLLGTLVLLALATGAAACHKQKEEAAPAPTPPPPPAPPPPADPADAVIKKVSAVLGCMNKDLRDLRDAGDADLTGYGRTAYTDMFVFDWMVAQPKRFDRDTAALCTEIKADYRRLFTATMAARAKRPAKVTMAPPAAEIDPEFVRRSQGVTALGLMEHETVTNEALLEATGGQPHPIFELVARASAATDVFREHDTRYHAQNEPYEPGWRERETAVDQEAFVGLMVQHLGHFRDAVGHQLYEIAAGDLGALCHMAEDLALNHGISRRQLAALRFFTKKAPSLEDPAVRANAKRWTLEMIKMTRWVLDDEPRWRKFLTWVAPAGLDPDRGFAWVFMEKDTTGRLTYVDLAKFYALQLPFHDAPELRKELGDGPDGLFHWDAAALFESAREKLQQGGFFQRRAKLASRGLR